MPVSAYFIIAANLLPLGLTLTGDWGLREILPLYWIESAIIGFFTVLKILLAGGLGSVLAIGGRLFIAGFFMFHFGMFMFVHGVFLFGLVLPGALLGSPQANPMDIGLWLEHLRAVKWGIVALFGGHAASFFLNFLAGGEYRSAEPKECMSQPYPRVLVMHLTILLGVFATIAIPSVGTILVVFVAAKIIADVSAHRKEHARAAAKAGQGTLMTIDSAEKPPCFNLRGCKIRFYFFPLMFSSFRPNFFA